MADHQQWVNLEKDTAFVEDEVKSIARLGPIHVEVYMKNGTKPSLLKVRVVPISTPQQYTRAEERRNPRFTLRRARQATTIDEKRYKLEEDIYLPAAGGNRYKVEGMVGEKMVEAPKMLTTWRKLYYQVVHMAGVRVPPMSSMEADYEGHYIKFKRTGPYRAVPYSTNTDFDTVSQRNQVVRAAASGYASTLYEPYTVCVFFVNMIAAPERNFRISPATSSKHPLRPGLLAWSGEDVSVTLPQGRYLWWGLNPIDDSRNGGRGIWLAPRSAYYVGDDGIKRSIPDTDIRVDTSKRVSELGGFNTLKIRLPWSARNILTSNTIRFELRLTLVAGFSGGYSEPNVNLITVAKSAWWEPYTDAERLQVLNHEMGHKIGMVPDGHGPSLDRPINFYVEQGHQGPHCASDAEYVKERAEPWQGAPMCVMFGATSCYDPLIEAHCAAPSTFCPDCEKLVRKLDLYAPDLPGIKNSVTCGHI